MTDDQQPPPPAYTLAEGALDYALTSNPFPLMASGAVGELVRAEMSLVISAAPGHEVLCRALEVRLPRGADTADALVESADGIEVSPSDDYWEYEVESTASTVSIVLTPKYDGFEFTNESLTVTMRGVGVNRHFGNSRLTIIEDCVPLGATEAGPPGSLDVQPTSVTLTVEKVPYRPPADFGTPNRFSAHRAAGSGADGTPATLVSAGSQVTLRWQPATGVERRLFSQRLTANDNDPGRDVSDRSVLTTEIVRTTAFTLRTKVIATGQTSYDTVTVQVEDPILAGLTVAGPLTVPESLTVRGTLAATGGLTAKQSLAVEGALTATGAVQASGAMAADQGAEVSGTLSAPGPTVVPGEVCAQRLETKDLTANTCVKMLKRGPWIDLSTSEPSFTAPTDGFFAAQLTVRAAQRIDLELKVSGDPGRTYPPSLSVRSLNNPPKEDTVLIPLRRGDTLTGRGELALIMTNHQESVWFPLGGS